MIDKINEKIEEERKDDEIRAERLKDKPVPVPREPDVSHQTLDRMFKRLATKPSVTGN